MFLRFLTLLCFCCAAFTADARLITEKKSGVLYVKSATTKEAEELFKQYDFDDFSQIKSKFPRIYFLRLPTDWTDVADSDDKHRTFIRIMIPLVLKVNEDVLRERAQILEFQQKSSNLTKSEAEKLEKLAEKYDAFTRLKGQQRTDLLLKQLLEKVDAVPASLLISTAGIYSNWGTSRLAMQANSLYLREIWYNNQGLKPLDDAEADYRYKMYGTLEESIADQVLKINTGINYKYLWTSRSDARKIDRPLYGPQVAAVMIADSNLKNIAGMIDYTFSYYKMRNVDYKLELENIK